jgi:hypothetical protein
MSVMLIMLPLGMIGGAALWLSRRAALADAELPSPCSPRLRSQARSPDLDRFQVNAPDHGRHDRQPQRECHPQAVSAISSADQVASSTDVDTNAPHLTKLMPWELVSRS